MEMGSKEEMPVFLCKQLELPHAVPVFLSRVDLASAWLRSGRAREAFKEAEDLTTMDLRMLVHQMQTDVFRWELLQFVPPSRAVAFLKKHEERMAKAVADGDEPPALEGD